MNITGIHQASGLSPAAGSKQDSHELTIQKQIISLQEKVRGIAYDSEMSSEEKSDEKKALQDKIQNLNSELKQYQAQKKQEEIQKRQEEAIKKQEEEARRSERNTTTADKTSAPSSSQAPGSTEEAQAGQPKDPTAIADNAGSGVMFAAAATKGHLSNMQKIRTDLEGQLRTASTDEEKASLQKKINNISKNMGKKIQKISDTITDAQNEEKARKEKVQKQLQEYRDRTKNVGVSVSRSDKTASTGNGYWKDNSESPGKVFLTRKRP